MAFNRPTLVELINRVLADLTSRLTQGGKSILRRSVAGIIGRVMAGLAHGLYGFIDWVSRQVFPDTADAENLERWAAIWGLTRKAATAAQGTIRFTGSNGAVIAAGTVLIRTDAVEFTTDAEVTIAGGQADVGVTCSSLGATGNTDIGTILNLQSPIANVDTGATVQDNGSGEGLTGGTNEETDEQLRQRLLQRIQQPPQAGSCSDYVRWALEVPGVTRAWCYELWLGPGTVGVTFVRDGEDPIIPSAPEVQEVADYIETLRPVTATVTVFAPAEQTIDLDIELLPNDTATQQAVTAEIEDYFKRFAPGDPVVLSNLSEAISLAEGEEAHNITSTTPAAVDGVITLAQTELPKLGTINFSNFP